MPVITRPSSYCLLLIGIGLAASPVSLAQNSDTQAYVGCADIQLATVDNRAPSDAQSYQRLPPAFQVETQKTTRILQGQSARDVVGTGEANEACWARLDGVWQDDSLIKFDDSIEISSWAGDQQNLKNLAHGNYTDTNLVVILPGTDTAREISVIDAFNNSVRTTFISDDDTPLSEALKIRGPRKVYTAQQDSGLGTELIIDVDINGFVRLRMNNTVYRRPSPGLIASFDTNDFNIDAPFVYNANLDNVVVSRSGYDISSADPFDFVGTAKKEVFKEVFGRQYRILEKRTVPLGFDLVPATDQGMLYTREFARTEAQLQAALSAAFGGKARVGVNTAIIPGPSASAGVDVTASIATDMRTNQYSSRAVGYSMTKKYAIVVDHPYIELSNDFRAAIEDARRYGDEDVRYYEDIITKFGTHYPYAVTYGANAELSVELSESETYERIDVSASARVEGEIEAVKGAVSGYASLAAELGTATTNMTGEERSMFRAVGGNGSWDEKGYAAGDRAAPILLDLRPLDQLLNPLNYPGQPDVYETVRTKLRAKIKDYLDLRAGGLSKWPIYNTVLDGDYFTEKYPALVFSFTPKNFVESEMRVRSINGSSWVQLQHMMVRPANYEDIKNEDRPFLQKRIESGAYRQVDSPARSYEASSQGLVPNSVVERASLQHRLKGDVSWTALPDGSVVLNGHSKDQNAPPIILRRWTEDDVAQAEAGRLSGGWRSSEWPGLVVLSQEITDSGQGDTDDWADVAHEFASVVVISDDGMPATLQCIDEAALQQRSAKDLNEVAGYSELIFHNVDPLDARHRLHFIQWFVGTMLHSALPKYAAKENLTHKEKLNLELVQCLFGEDAPLGVAPTILMGADPDELFATGKAMPEIALKPDGSLKLSFYEPLDFEGGSFERNTNIYDETHWNQVGKELTFMPIPDREAAALLATYRQKRTALKTAAQAEQDNNPS
ncbi:MAG: MAC/perforin domain-containing protein [Henriciella sp.]